MASKRQWFYTKRSLKQKQRIYVAAAHCLPQQSTASAGYQQTRALCIAPSTQCAPIWRAGRPLWQNSNFVQILCSSDFWPRALTYAVPGVAFDDDSASFERVSYTFQKNHLIFFFHYFTSLFQGKSRYFCRIISNHILSYPTIWS